MYQIGSVRSADLEMLIEMFEVNITEVYSAMTTRGAGADVVDGAVILTARCVRRSCGKRVETTMASLSH
jgi:hypothetical protein